jgi:hypothetical protein
MSSYTSISARVDEKKSISDSHDRVAPDMRIGEFIDACVSQCDPESDGNNSITTKQPLAHEEIAEISEIARANRDTLAKIESALDANIHPETGQQNGTEQQSTPSQEELNQQIKELEAMIIETTNAVQNMQRTLDSLSQ